MRRAVVTGATGFIGRYLVDELLCQGYEVWAVMRERYRASHLPLQDGVHTVFCDLENISGLDQLIRSRGFDGFYHLAWDGSSGAKRADHVLQLANARACTDAAKAAAALGCRRFIGVGSVTELMYGGYLQRDAARPEMTVCYAIAKMTARDMSRCVCVEHGVDFLWGQIANFYGVGDKSQNIINYVAKAYLHKETPSLTAGAQKADFLYVSDVARALIAMEQRGQAGAIYYVGYGEPRPLREFILQTRDAVDQTLDAGLGRRSFRGLDVDFDAADMKRLQRDTGFAPEVGFADGICWTVQWLRDTMQGADICSHGR